MKKSKGPCWTGYTMVGMKSKGGRKVPNCVPVKKAKEGLSVRPYDPRDKKQKKITDKQNPISEYDPKTKKLKYTAAKVGMNVNTSSHMQEMKKASIKTKKVAKALHKASGLHKAQAKTLESIKLVRGGGIAIRGLNFQGVK